MLKKLTIVLFIVIISPFLTSCSILKNSVDAYTAQKMRGIQLNYWRVWDDEDAFRDIIKLYESRHPNIKINYKKLRYDEYEKELIEAFAVDKGPDIFSLHNTWTRKYQSKGLLEPMPPVITMVYPYLEGSIKKEVKYRKISTKHSPAEVKKNFVDVVYDDVVIKYQDPLTYAMKEEIYALPLSIDTLVMYYNKDLFNNAGITAPADNWTDMLNDVKKLTKQNNKGEIIQAGIGLGGGSNVERSTDILAALMMQNGTIMMENGVVKFHSIPEGFQNRSSSPGVDAFRFYTDFANPAKEVYCWNNTLENSLNMFSNEKLAILFGYAYMLPTINAANARLHFDIAPFPQIAGNEKVNFANYWVEAVSKKSANKEEAWDFVRFMTAFERAQMYLAKTKKPTALRDLIESQLEDPELEVFANQILTAKSWYKGDDANAAEQIMIEMIENVVASQGDHNRELNLSASKVQQTVELTTSY